MNEDGEPCDEHEEPVGKWIKGLNRNRTCFLYIHMLSREIRGVRPRGYEESDKEKAVAAKREAQKDPHAAMLTCTPEELTRACRDVIRRVKKTPLVLSAGDDAHAAVIAKLGSAAEGQVSEFVVNTRPFVHGPIRTKIKMPDAVENARKVCIATINVAMVIMYLFIYFVLWEGAGVGCTGRCHVCGGRDG